MAQETSTVTETAPPKSRAAKRAEKVTGLRSDLREAKDTLKQAKAEYRVIAKEATAHERAVIKAEKLVERITNQIDKLTATS